MILYSIYATAPIQGKDPTAVCQQLALAPPGTHLPRWSVADDLSLTSSRSHIIWTVTSERIALDSYTPLLYRGQLP